MYFPPLSAFSVQSFTIRIRITNCLDHLQICFRCFQEPNCGSCFQVFWRNQPLPFLHSYNFLVSAFLTRYLSTSYFFLPGNKSCTVFFPFRFQNLKLERSGPSGEIPLFLVLFVSFKEIKKYCFELPTGELNFSIDEYFKFKFHALF